MNRAFRDRNRGEITSHRMMREAELGIYGFKPKVYVILRIG
jgi:hypothetical protein